MTCVKRIMKTNRSYDVPELCELEWNYQPSIAAFLDRRLH